ncbi:MAG: class I SAM-dependent methyltransferase [Chloroflexota bacterium]|nr:class I SAM-dependent methyltransferase [Chloroflexota bacterium]
MADASRVDGTRVFGIDPAGYDQARPDYPARVYDLLQARCPIGPLTRGFEIGPGTGIASRQLLARGLGSLVAIEPDPRLADFLAAHGSTTAGRLQIQVATFAEAELPASSFDLGVAATAYHWLDSTPTLEKVAQLLRPGGTWAMWWNVFGDPLGDAFHEATLDLLGAIEPDHLRAPARQPAFPLDREARLSELEGAGFVDATYDLTRWSHPFDAGQTRALYATFPHIRTLPPVDRERVLTELGRIVDNEFAGLVERPMLTPLYTARRP